jgi:hypothetical protein
MPSSDDVEEVGGDGEEVQELAEDGKLEKSYASIADV